MTSRTINATPARGIGAVRRCCLPSEGINLQHSLGQVKRSAIDRGLLALAAFLAVFRPWLPVLPQPCAIVRGDEGAKPRQAWMVGGSRLQIGENLPQRPACDRPIVRALPQHQPRVADRPTHGFIYEGVHLGVRCLSVGGIWNKGGKGGAAYVMWQASRFGAGRVTASQGDGRQRTDPVRRFGI
jgi:hypothetical protein